MNILIMGKSKLLCYISTGVIGMVGGVVNDQADADEDMSVQQRLILAGGSALSEGGGLVGDLTGVEVAANAMAVTGKCQ